GTGKAQIELINASNALQIHNLSTPVMVSPDSVKLGPFTGKVANGDITGNASLSLAEDSRYTLNLQIKNADVVQLIKESGLAQQLFSAGKLQIDTSLTGTGGVPTIVGEGKIEITGGQLVDIPLLNQIGSVLQIAALQNLKFDE
ncbi:AsmA family protein, partial [Escherichia coli]|uniref:AsmA family protein n=1 Tax=Escherichia coli TaxID=562 RepID=UPI0015C96C25